MPQSITQKGSKGTSGLASLGAATQAVQQAPVASAIQGAQTAQAPMQTPTPAPAIQGAQMAQAQTAAPTSGMAQAAPPKPTWIGSSPAAKPAGAGASQKTKTDPSGALKNGAADTGQARPLSEGAAEKSASSNIELPTDLKNAFARMGTLTKVKQGFYKAINNGEDPDELLRYTFVNYGPEVADKMKMDYEITKNLSSSPKVVSADEFLSLIDEYGSAYVKMFGIMPESIMGMPDGQGVIGSLGNLEDSDFVKIQDAMGDDWMEEYQYQKKQDFKKKVNGKIVATINGITDAVSTIGKAAMGNQEAQGKVLAVTGNIASGAFESAANFSKVINPFTYVENNLPRPDSNSPTYYKAIYGLADILAPQEYTDAAAQKFSTFVDDRLGDVPWADTVGSMAFDLYAALGAGKLASYVYAGAAGKAGSVLKGTQMYMDAFKAAPSMVGGVQKGVGVMGGFAVQSMAETAGFIAAARGELPTPEDYAVGMFFDGLFRGGGALLKDYLSPLIYNTAVVPKVSKGAGHKKVASITQFGLDKAFGTKAGFIEALDGFIDLQYKDVQSIVTKIDEVGEYSFDLKKLQDRSVWDQFNDVALMDPQKAEAIILQTDSFVKKWEEIHGSTIVNASKVLEAKKISSDFIGKNWDLGVAAEPTIAGKYQANFQIWKTLDDELDTLHPAIKPLNASMSSAISLKSPIATFLERKGAGMDLSVFSGFQKFPTIFPILTTLAKVVNSTGKGLKYAGKLDTGKLLMEEVMQEDEQFFYQK